MNALIGGCNTYSKRRMPANAPALAWSADGCHVNCSDSRRYVDYVAALGAVILGHGHKEVNDAVHAQIECGVSFSLPTHLEYQLADRMAELTGFECVRFGKNGNDVTNAAVRVARAHTGRDGVLRFDGSYHGHADPFMTEPPKNGGVPLSTLGLTVFVPRFDAAALARKLSSKTIACVITEAAHAGDPRLPPPGWFDEVRTICDHYGVLLILDEMVTGFRAGHPGALTTWQIRPDMACYGKAIANGFPLSVLCGSEALLSHIETDVFFSTTFAGENVSIAAALATLDVLEAEDVALALTVRGRRLIRAYEWSALRHGLGDETYLYGYPSRPMLYFTDPQKKKTFLEAMVGRGYLTQGYFNLMLAHDDVIINDTIMAFDECLSEISGLREAA